MPDAANPHNAIVCDLNSNGEVILPKGSKLQEFIDPTTGRFRSNVVYGTAEVSPRQGGGQDLIWLNSDKGTAAAMDFGPGGQTTVAADVWGLRPPIGHEFGDPAFLAGWRREKDKDLDKLRKQEKEKASNLVHGEAAEKGVKPTTETTGTTGAVTAGAGGGGGGTGTIEGAKKEAGGGGTEETKKDEPIKGKDEVPAGTFADGVEKAKDATETTKVEGAKTEQEKKTNPTLLKRIHEFNKDSRNHSPHINLEFEKEMLVSPSSKETLGFVLRLKTALLEDQNSGIRLEQHRDRNIRLKFKSMPPYAPITDEYGRRVLQLSPDITMNALVPIIRRQLQGAGVDRGGQGAGGGNRGPYRGRPDNRQNNQRPAPGQPAAGGGPPAGNR